MSQLGFSELHILRAQVSHSQQLLWPKAKFQVNFKVKLQLKYIFIS